MNANELRLGNLVRSKYNGISKVDQIGSSINSEYVGGRSLDGNYWENSCLPIPLTAEWLEAFGFKENTTSWTKFCKYCHLKLKKTTGKRLMIGSLQVKHVHQLQNLYFALTGEELTITKW